MCEVVNFKQYGSVTALNRAYGDEWVYIGRANSQTGLAASPLANPYKVRAFGGQRGATLGDYRRWLWARIQAGDTAVLEALRGITAATTLVCWCKPGPCHGDVVKAAVEWLRAHEDMRAHERKQHIVFVSGHRDLSVSEFYAHYQARLDKAVAAGHRFVVGDAPGADTLTQLYLVGRVSPARVTVYHAGNQPRQHVGGLGIKGGFTSQSAKDAAMTAVSDDDIAWVRPGKETSGTARNLARRGQRIR